MNSTSILLMYLNVIKCTLWTQIATLMLTIIMFSYIYIYVYILFYN